MSKYYYPTIFIPDEELGGFGVVIPDLPGCFSQGDNLLEAAKYAESAIDCWLDGIDEKDYPKPSKVSDIDTSEYIGEYQNLIVNIVEYDPQKFKK